MSTRTDDALIERLGRLGDDIDREVVREHVDGAETLVEAVLVAIETPGDRRGRPWIAAAMLLLVAALGVLAVPDSRHAVARWFGLDGVGIEIEPNLSLPPADGLPDDLVPGEQRVVQVGGREILVLTIHGRLDERLITKTVGSTDQVQEVTVNGEPGLWIAGAPHEVLYEDPESDIVVERVAANTLLWNDGELLYRVEGFDLLEQALDYAQQDVATPVDD